ncbi:hypothetical protein [Burkholderia singularis]|uniref:hypothetical protein n=1 Tax=Burkholderia singularis TaxID=1503053 RepID=UPI000F7754E1|nr:hypothetical protein [Burkholderia singularis]
MLANQTAWPIRGHEIGGCGRRAYKKNILYGDTRKYPDADSWEIEIQKNIAILKIMVFFIEADFF